MSRYHFGLADMIIRGGRTPYRIDFANSKDYEATEEVSTRRNRIDFTDPNCWGSMSVLNPAIHLPCFDVDHVLDLARAQVFVAKTFPNPRSAPNWIPSTTEGHFHVYVDWPYSWHQYSKALEELMVGGYVEKNYWSVSVARKETFVRMPHIKKVT